MYCARHQRGSNAQNILSPCAYGANNRVHVCVHECLCWKQILNKELHKDIFTNCDTCHRGKYW